VFGHVYDLDGLPRGCGLFGGVFVALAAHSNPELTPSTEFDTVHTTIMNALLQTGTSGRGPVPPEKRFFINFNSCG
jgi:hypothetical protein